MVAVGQIERGWLGVKRHIRAQPQLPRAGVSQITHDRILPDSVGRVHRRLGKKFVLVDPPGIPSMSQ
jgi:hypothetical protein